MHIQKVTIENVRNFRRVELDLQHPDGTHAGWNVFAGRNGSGKTTLLQAIATCVMPYRTLLAVAPSLGEDWSRTKPVIDVSLVAEGLEDLVPEDEVREGAIPPTNENGFEIPWTQTREAMRTGISLGYWRQIAGFGVAAAGCDPFHVLRAAESYGWFAAAYGAFRRRSGTSEHLERMAENIPFFGAFATLFFEEAALTESVAWLRDVHFRALDKQDASLAALRDAALRLLNDGLLPDGVVAEKVDSDGLWMLQQGKRVRVDELSSGYRTLLALVLDILARMHRSFGTRFRVEATADGHHVVLHSGVVLIDEIEEHLHPRWQREIGFWFKRHFPAVQFLVTTHSPFVCQAADAGGLFRLPGLDEPDGAVRRVDHATWASVVHGTLDDAVMTELFGLDSLYTPRTERLRDEAAELEAKRINGELDADGAKRLDALHEELPEDNLSLADQAERALLRAV